MTSSNHKKRPYTAFGTKQRGAALILLVFIIGLAVTALMIKSFSAASLKSEQDENTTLSLSQAKETLIAWAVSYADLPGMMPYPNRGTDSAGYEDGGSDCFAANISLDYHLLMGMLPSRDSNDTNCLPLTRRGLPLFQDASGNSLWYAISRNLVRNYHSSASNPVINPGMSNVDTSKTMPYDGTAMTSPYPWMIVKDETGAVISDRVAAVIIAPGSPLTGQNRTNTANATHFLDQITFGANTYSNRDYDQPDEDFVIGANSSSTFNDRLVYITIDELMFALEKRVAAEAKAALLAYRSAYGDFPFASPIGSTLNYSCKNNLTEGFLPLDSSVPFSTISCTGGNSCTGINFSDISSITYTNTVFTWTGATGSCNRSGKICTCSGAGSCTAFFGLVTYSCNLAGVCASNIGSGSAELIPAKTDVINTTGAASACSSRVTIPGAGTFTGSTCSHPGISPKLTVNTISGSEVLTGSGFDTEMIWPGMYIDGDGIADETTVVSVTNNTTLVMSKNATASGSSEVRVSRLNPWFFDNGWQNYVYYAMSGSSGLTVGTRQNVTAILVTMGKEITTEPFAESKVGIQSRTLSCDAKDYLDSIENSDTTNSIFDASNKSRKQNYNDQIFIVAP